MLYWQYECLFQGKKTKAILEVGSIGDWKSLADYAAKSQDGFQW